MPYKSEAQRRFMYSQHPDIAARWNAEGKNYIESNGRKVTRRGSRRARRR